MKMLLKFLTLFMLVSFAATPAYAYAETASATQFSDTALVALTNADRAANGASPVIENPLLSKAAQEKADDMVANDYFAHYAPNGTSPWHWFTAVGYYYMHAGENLAMNFDDPVGLEAAWMASPAHRANIVKGVYTQVGIGIAHGVYEGKPVVFVVELFATPAKN